MLHHHLHQHTIYDTMNQNSLKVYNYNNVYIQNICNCELLDQYLILLTITVLLLTTVYIASEVHNILNVLHSNTP